MQTRHFGGVQFKKKHIPTLILFGTHNLLTFKHNRPTLINKLLIIFTYLIFVLNWKWLKLRVTRTACQQKKHARVIFGMQFENNNMTTSKPTWKLKHANSILGYYEFFCQMSSKSSLEPHRFKVGAFFWDTVYDADGNLYVLYVVSDDRRWPSVAYHYTAVRTSVKPISWKCT